MKLVMFKQVAAPNQKLSKTEFLSVMSWVSQSLILEGEVARHGGDDFVKFLMERGIEGERADYVASMIRFTQAEERPSFIGDALNEMLFSLSFRDGFTWKQVGAFIYAHANALMEFDFHPNFETDIATYVTNMRHQGIDETVAENILKNCSASVYRHNLADSKYFVSILSSVHPCNGGRRVS